MAFFKKLYGRLEWIENIHDVIDILERNQRDIPLAEVLRTIEEEFNERIIGCELDVEFAQEEEQSIRDSAKDVVKSIYDNSIDLIKQNVELILLLEKVASGKEKLDNLQDEIKELKTEVFDLMDDIKDSSEEWLEEEKYR